MPFEITEIPENEFEQTGWNITFQLGKYSPIVTAEAVEGNNHKLRIVSETDGYHWLQFWAAQDPDEEQLIKLTPDKEVAKVRLALENLGFEFEPEDKESGFLQSTETVTLDTVQKVAEFLEPRFALRERFFTDDI